MSSPKTIGLVLEPLDVLFFRDGRPFEFSSQVASGLPSPQTVAGSLRTWLLCRAGWDFEKAAKEKRFAEAVREEGSPAAAVADLRFRGPWLALKGEDDQDIEPLVHVPATLLKIEESEEIVRLDPLKDLPLPGWSPPEKGMLPLWRRDQRPAKRVEGYLRLKGLEDFLAGQVPDRKEILPDKDLFQLDRRVGIAIDPNSLTAEKEKIYAASLLALNKKKNVRLYAEVVGPEDVLKELLHAESEPPAVLPLGGEGRQVSLRPVKAVKWPQQQPAQEQGTLLLLTTPGLFDRNRADQGSDENRRKAWRPDLLAGNLAAAAVPGHQAFSGWDLARRGPKPNRFAVPAGSVYFLKCPLEPRPEALFSDEKDLPQGWGSFVEGVWNYV